MVCSTSHELVYVIRVLISKHSRALSTWHLGLCSFPMGSHISTAFNTCAYDLLSTACSTKTQACSHKNIIQHVLISVGSTYWPLTNLPTLRMSYKDNQFTPCRTLASNTSWLPNQSLHTVGFLIKFVKDIKKDHYITVQMRWLSDKSYCYLWHRQQQYDRHLKTEYTTNVFRFKIYLYIMCQIWWTE